MNDDGFLPGMLLAFIICFFFFQWVRGNIDESWRQQISDHGCAGFYLDSDNKRQWDWKK